ncbi:hypothetical protein EJP67_10770 [Variovorax guangxiensis]|uniref:Uncharacterized protein n=1 Tax=Variovorax guangxiensis TaxID=1775474 RepID=A0A3S0ZMU4_9BURK|nr:hypothetical protein [Variovorax guangxiensis]RUR67537.1 hypothetical protein EJP67_10770 [Variovorax guangxiensis]
MSLVTRTRELHARLALYGATKSSYNEAKQLDELRITLIEKRVARARDLLAARTVLAGHDMPSIVAAPSADLVKKTATLLQRFRDNPVKVTLAKETAWPAVEKLVDLYLNSAEKSARTAWGRFCEAKVPTDDPQGLKTDPELKFDPENLVVLREYEPLYKSLAVQSGSLPTRPEIAAKFVEDAQRAHALLDQLRRNMPPAVRRFLEQVQGGRVPLDQVTADVLTWLGGEGRLGEFEVRRKTP